MVLADASSEEQRTETVGARAEGRRSVCRSAEKEVEKEEARGNLWRGRERLRHARASRADRREPLGAGISGSVGKRGDDAGA